MAQINAGGVVLLDVKLGNIVKGEHSGALYWIDFEHSRFLGDWDWKARLVRQQHMIDGCLEAALAARPAHGAGSGQPREARALDDGSSRVRHVVARAGTRRNFLDRVHAGKRSEAA